MATFLVWGVPETGFIVIGLTREVRISGAALFGLLAVFYFLSGGLVGSAISEKMYPLSSITFGTSVERPWYTQWAHQLLGALIVSVIAGVLVALLFR
jgi:hypothetical protein